ncbi:MAG: class GN sortase [Woeseiaceae bacterium]|nr:class GN sortase [Woeseiaceae bacterium]
MASVLALGFWQFGQGAYVPAKAWMAQELLQRAWLKTAVEDLPQAPWPWADTYPVARIRAKAGGIDVIVLAGSSGRTLAFGPGHMSASALPGDAGNSVIAGHRDTHFRFLQFMSIGESLFVERPDGSSHRFRVSGIDVVDARRGSILLDTDEAMLSLVTCYPFDSEEPGGPLRYVVTARRSE